MSDEMSEQPIVTGKKSDDPRSKTWFKPGNCANPRGRPKGARSKLGEAFIEAMLNDFESHGVAAIQKVRHEKPEQYLKVIASILPKELNVNTNAVEELNDDDLAAAIATLQSVFVAKTTGGGAGQENGQEPAQELRPVH